MSTSLNNFLKDFERPVYLRRRKKIVLNFD